LIVDGGTSPRSTYTTIINLAEKGMKYRIMRVGAVPVQAIEDLLGDQ
jgi:tRNA A37 threonylcarbamoyladenosine synthetase subunit TsaC/SUA5/YrdC